MIDRESFPMPTEAEKSRAVAAILDAGLPAGNTLQKQLRQAWKLPPSVLFFGMGDCLFLAVAAGFTLFLWTVSAAAAARPGPLATLLFLFSPALYAALHGLTAWKESMTGTLEWKQTCKLSFRVLTALRMLVFGGASVAVCVPADVLLWAVSGREISLLWMLGLSFSSLFLYAALSLCCQGSRQRPAALAAPLTWLCLGVCLLRWERAADWLLEVPAAVFFLLAGIFLLAMLARFKYWILRPMEGGLCHAVR